MARTRILTTRFFHRWADDEGLTSDVLVQAVREIEGGLSDGDLGGVIIKKRVRVGGRGKSGGARVLLVLAEEQLDDRTHAKVLIEIGPQAAGAAEPNSPRGP
jgi:hypothetical protein